MSEFAVRAICGAPLLGDLQDRVDLLWQQGVHRRAAGTAVLEAAAALGASGPPAVNPVIAHPPQRGGPTVRQPRGDSLINSVEHQLLDLGAGSRGNRTA